MCGERGDKPYLKKEGMTLVRCADCGMVFVKNVSRALAEGTFYNEGAKDLYVSNDKLRGDYSPVRYKRELRL
ncbi:MAG TPA: hypothetical protein VGR78_04775, partial [Verrucomicrobiae bacterium]|nr:hypothetical protein [Verrucomicrobiae bacterium]